MLANRFLEKAQSSLLVPIYGEQEVEGLTFFVNGTVLVLLQSLDQDVGLVHPPIAARGPLLTLRKLASNFGVIFRTQR